MGTVLTAESQRLHYLVRLGDEQMGDMRATKTIGIKEKYLIESKIKIDKMIKFDFFNEVIKKEHSLSSFLIVFFKIRSGLLLVFLEIMPDKVILDHKKS